MNQFPTKKVLYFNLKRTIWLKGYQNDNRIRAVRTTAARN